MNGFEKRAELKKAAIRSAATDLFIKHGVRKVSVREIAQAAGVSQVSIFNYFKNKAGLIRAVVEFIVSEQITATRSILKSDVPFPDKLKGIILMKTEGAQMLQGEFLKALLRQSPESGEILQTVFGKEIRNLMDELFRQGRESGHIDQVVSSAALYAYIDIFRNGTREWANGSQPPDATIIGEVITLFFRGMAPS